MEHKVVSRDEWLSSQKDFLKKEKEFTRQRDELAKQRRALPWTLVEKNYSFDTTEGKKTLSELFGDKRQLFVQHFMFSPDWNEGCPGCSFEADHISGDPLTHITQKDVNFVAISRAPLEKLQAYRKRMGWTFPWVSSYNTDFNYDFHVSFKKPKDGEKIYYNYEWTDFAEDGELPGNSVFYKNDDGKIFLTYSSYARGCESLMSTYMLFDLLPKGRDEDNFKFHPMEWVKRHDQYKQSTDSSCCHK